MSHGERLSTQACRLVGVHRKEGPKQRGLNASGEFWSGLKVSNSDPKFPAGAEAMSRSERSPSKRLCSVRETGR